MAANRGNPLLDDDLITNVISMNFSGRFKGHEVKDLGGAVMRHMVAAKSVDLFFGQQANFRLSSLPDNYDVIGSQRAFLMYNRKRFQANDELQYRHFLRDLELKGRLQKYYLPEANYTLCKMKSKVMDDTSFIAMSWFTDEGKDQLRSLNLLRKLLSFTANLCAIEEMPVVIAGSFRLSLEDVKQVVYNEFEGFRCYGYRTDKNRRAARMCNIYVSCPPLKLEEVKPVVSGKLEIYGNKIADRWRHLEDAFYWDPVYGRMLRRSGTSSVASPESPRAISPHSFDNFGAEDESGSTLQLGECPYVDPQHPRPTFPSAEDTLKVLLAESERIKELVSEAETKARMRLEARTKPGRQGEQDASDRAPASSAAVQLQVTEAGHDVGFPMNFDLEAEARKVSESLRSGARSSIDEDEEFQMLEKAFSAQGLESKHKADDVSDGTAADKQEQSSMSNVLETSHPSKPKATTLELPSCPLRKMPSYIDLYDEELIDSNKVCYMQ